MANEEMQQDIMEFEKSRQQLMGISSQKQQFQFQSATIGKAADALEKTKEKKVFKAIGNIMIQEDTDSVAKELKEQKELIDLRVKTLQKQEDTTVQKLNKLRQKIAGKTATEETEKKETETKNSKKK